MSVITIPGMSCTACGHKEFYAREEGGNRFSCVKCRAPYEILPREDILSRAPKESKCRECGAPIRWMKMSDGTSKTVNAKQHNFIVLKDGEGELVKGWVPHYATCPKRKQGKGRG